MNARGQLNVVYINGCLIIAAIVGALLQSWPVFFVALVVAVAVNIHEGGIRLSGGKRRR